MNYIWKDCWLSSKPREDRSSPYALTFFNIRMITYAFVMGGNYPQTRKFRNIRSTVQERHGATVNVYAQRYSTSLNTFPAYTIICFIPWLRQISRAFIAGVGFAVVKPGGRLWVLLSRYKDTILAIKSNRQTWVITQVTSKHFLVGYWPICVLIRNSGIMMLTHMWVNTRGTC